MSDTQLATGIPLAIFAPYLIPVLPVILGSIAADEAGQAASDAAEAEAALEEDKARTTAKSLRRRNALLAANEQLQYRKNGIRTDTGSPAEVLIQNVGQRELEALDVELFGRNAASLARHKGRNAKAVARTQIASQVLSVPNQILGVGASLLTLGGAGGSLGQGLGSSRVPQQGGVGSAIAAGGPAR